MSLNILNQTDMDAMFFELQAAFKKVNGMDKHGQNKCLVYLEQHMDDQEKQQLADFMVRKYPDVQYKVVFSEPMHL